MPGDSASGILATLQDYYSISQDEVIERLAREAEATRIYRPLRDFLGEAYAGAWFDGNDLVLVVATTDASMAEPVRRLGARPQLVEHSLAQLEELATGIGREAASDADFGEAVTGWYVDYPANSVVVDALAVKRQYVQARVAAIEDSAVSIRVDVSRGYPELANEIRGADCYENTEFTELQEEPFRCSMGFAVAGGFITAGHCGRAAEQDPVTSCNDVSMGAFAGSTWHSAGSLSEIKHDRGWVETISPWQPVPKVNGYNDGILSVPAASGGHVEAPVNATVCRYGQKSQGPHCGQILAKNQTQEFCAVNQRPCPPQFTVELEGVTNTDVCVESGDSGGSYISGDGQAQGTTIGGFTGTCPDPSESWFEPAGGTLSEFGDMTLLTTHGANPPDITLIVCPDNGTSGNGIYMCWMTYDTQGPTPIEWTTNTGNSSTSTVLFGSCAPHETVNVNLTVTNPYGSDHRFGSFECPTNPLP